MLLQVILLDEIKKIDLIQQSSDLPDWVYTLKTDTKIITSLVSSTRLRLNFLEFLGRDFDKAFSGFFETETEIFIFLISRLRL